MKTCNTESRCYRTGKYTVCRRVRASFSPDILQAVAVKGLMYHTVYTWCMSFAIPEHGTCLRVSHIHFILLDRGTYTRTPAHAHTHSHTHTQARTHARTHVRTHTHTHTLTQTRVSARAQTQTHIRTLHHPLSLSLSLYALI